MNKIIQGNCVDIMTTFPDNYVDLTVTSPPYDKLREYNGYDFTYEGIAIQLYRITKQGGVVVWVAGDSTVDGSETGTSFNQALYFKDCGFNLHDTMIWNKLSPPPNDSRQNRYVQGFEYMFVFSKGKPKTCNYIKTKSIHVGKIRSGKRRESDGSRRHDYNKIKTTVNDEKIISNVWDIDRVHNYNKHPATFPEKLANDHIISWSNEGDLILDPMCGSGTTCKMAMINNRNYIGIDISGEYCEIARNRITEYEQQLTFL